MSKILSYILFETKTLPTWRTWDKCSQERDRYWYNIPALVALNKVLYPEHEMRLYLSKNVWDKNPNAEWIQAPSRKGDAKETLADVESLAELGWIAKNRIKEGLETCF